MRTRHAEVACAGSTSAESARRSAIERHEHGNPGDEEDEDREPRYATRRTAGAAKHAAPARDHQRQRRPDDPLRTAHERHELLARQASFPLNARPSR